jgi:outer membrane protein TolC
MLNALDLQQQASEKSEIAAQRQGLPKVGVGLDYAIVGKRTDMEVEDNGKNIFMPMVSVSIPIFRKKYKAAEKEAQLMQEKYSYQKKETINSLTSGYESVWFHMQQQKDLIDLYKEQILESNQTLNLLFSAYGNSGKDFEEVLRMQQQLLKYEKMKATAETQYQTALAKLNYITAKTY